MAITPKINEELRLVFVENKVSRKKVENKRMPRNERNKNKSKAQSKPFRPISKNNKST